MLALVVGLQLLLASCSAEPADLPGHMKPLGSHRDPELVTRIVHAPSVVEFQQEYAQPRRPLVMEGILANTDLIKNWQQDEYLRRQFGEENVSVEHGKKENRSLPAFHTSMADYLDRYQSEDIYMVTDMPDTMKREWLLPKFLLCGGYTSNLMYVYIWFSSGGTKSVLHTDSYENLHCLVSGRKEFILIEPKYSSVIGPEHEQLGFFFLDVERVNMTAYPGLAGVPWHLAIVNAGDCLYLPYNWMHSVASFDRNLGVNVWWSPFDFNEEECPNEEDMPDFAPLGKFQITPELQLKQILKEQCAVGGGSVTAEQFHREIYKRLGDEGVPPVEYIEQMFRTLDPDCNGTLHSSRLDSISLVKYKTAFEYILNVTEQLSIERQRKDQEFEGDDVNFMYFDEEFGGYGDYDYEDPEPTEGRGHSEIPPQQHRRDEL